MFAGGPVCWKSGRQPIEALSTTEADYIAMTLVAKEATAVRNLLSELQYCGDGHHVIPLHDDNLPAIDLLSRTSSDGRTKHIDVRYHYIRREAEKGAIKVVKVKTYNQIADGLTKALDRRSFERFREMIGVMDCTSAVDGTTGD